MPEAQDDWVEPFRVASTLAEALTVEEVASAIFDHVAAYLGVRSVGLWLLDDDNAVLRFEGGAGYERHVTDGLIELSVDVDLPGPVAVRTGRPVVYASRAERDRDWPGLGPLPTTTEAGVVLPLAARGHRIGCLALAFAAAREFTGEELTRLTAVGEQCALALDRARLYESERASRETLEFLAQATQLLVSAVEPGEVVRRLVRLAVPRFADWCAVYVAEDRMLRRVALAVDQHRDAGRDLLDVSPLPLDAPLPVTRAFHTGQIQEIDAGSVTAVATAAPGRFADFVAAFGVESGLAVPIRARGETIGVMSVINARARPRHRHLEWAVTGLASRAGIALDNAWRYRVQTDAVETLTAALLPARLPAVAGYELAARYVPAEGGVCGDWYEADLLPGGDVLLGLGDAAGHGMHAAAMMAALRHGAKALARRVDGPAELLDQLARLVEADDAHPFATAWYARLDPYTGRGRWASAGHPPALLVNAAGQVRALEPPTGVALGVPHTTGHIERPLALAQGDMLVMVSDGVIERRAEQIDVGINRLADLVAGEPDLKPEAVADLIVSRLCRSPEDDCCVLTIRRDPA